MRRLVLLPGLDGTGALFDPLLRVLPRSAKAEIASLPPESLSYGELADRLAARHSPDVQTVLVAESFSGPIAIELAARFRVAALILCNSFVVPPRARGLAWLAAAAILRVPPPAALLRRFLVGPAAPSHLVSQLRAAIASTPAAVLSSRVASALRVDVRDRLACCSAPILYLRGSEDRIVRETSVAAIVTAASTPVRLVRLVGPHLLLQVEPAASWQAIDGFLASLPQTDVRS